MLEPMAQEMGKEMLRFHRLYGEKISRRFRQLHIDRLSQTEYLLLAIIVERKHLPMSELCERAMMRKQQVTQTVNQLEDKSLVVRVRNNENRRVVWLEPTEQAIEIAREVQRALVEELYRGACPKHDPVQCFDRAYAETFIEECQPMLDDVWRRFQE